MIGELHSFDVSTTRDQTRRYRFRRVDAGFDRPLSQDRVCRIALTGPAAWSSANICGCRTSRWVPDGQAHPRPTYLSAWTLFEPLSFYQG